MAGFEAGSAVALRLILLSSMGCKGAVLAPILKCDDLECSRRGLLYSHAAHSATEAPDRAAPLPSRTSSASLHGHSSNEHHSLLKHRERYTIIDTGARSVTRKSATRLDKTAMSLAQPPPTADEREHSVFSRSMHLFQTNQSIDQQASKQAL